tara:strand:- start:1540 stop:2154 length:615 start_codon:yes stop_codon:yes gene_type:complete
MTYKVPFIIEDNFLPQNELEDVWTETKSLYKNLRPGWTSNPATKDGEVLKQNSHLFYHEFYGDAYNESITSEILIKRIIHDKFLDKFEDRLVRDLAQNINWQGLMLSYYDDGDSYKPHHDQAMFTVLYWLHKQPKKFSGGKLHLYNDTTSSNPEAFIPFEPRHNRILIFPSPYMHEVTPVTLNEEDRKKGLGRYCITMFCGIQP